MNERNIDRLFIASLVIFAASAFALHFYGHSVTAILSLIIPGGMTASLYSYAKKSISDMLYYFVLDGLMALSAVLYYIATGFNWQ